MLFDRNFVVGYVLPAAIFLGISLVLLHGFGLLPHVFVLTEADIPLFILIAGIASWIVGLCLFIVNVDIVGLMEGYGRFNPARFFGRVQTQRYRELNSAISELDKKYKECISNGEKFPDELQPKRSELMLKRAMQFPDQERWLLPTAFGNAIRAFEVYPRVMYGLESVQGWARLLAVIPKEYREFVDTAKARTDFWVNLWFLSLLTIVEYMGASFYTDEFKIPLVLGGAFVSSFIASRKARKAAYQWGEWKKASVDVFLAEFRTKLGFLPPATIEQEQDIWTAFSQAIIYRRPDSMKAVQK